MKKTFILSITLLFLFTGCIYLTKELPSYKTYTLELKTSKNTTSKYVDKSIYVVEPKAINSINTLSVNYSKENYEQEKYVLSKWSDKPTKMLQELITNFLVSKNTYKYITSSNIKLFNHYRLVSQLVDFKHSFNDENSYANFSIRVYLINNENEKISFKNFTYTQKASTNDAKGVVLAFNEISKKFLFDLDSFIFKSITTTTLDSVELED